jgi:hypothetical protein
MTKLTGYHGLTGSDALTGAWRGGEMYAAFDRTLAEDVAIGGKVYAVTYEARNPLVLDTPARFIAVWTGCGADAATLSFARQKALLCRYARERGHDAVCIPASAFEGEDGYEWLGGTFGEPQMILLEPGRAVLTPC